MREECPLVAPARAACSSRDSLADCPLCSRSLTFSMYEYSMVCILRKIASAAWRLVPSH